jgi:hypothetical protein
MIKRHFTRVEYHVAATISGAGSSFSSMVENLSLKGVLLRTDQRLPLGQPVDITISLLNSTPPVELHLKAVVVRSTEGELGCRFDKVDVDSFTHLRNIISYTKGDGDAVMDEFIEFVEENAHADEGTGRGN